MSESESSVPKSRWGFPAALLAIFVAVIVGVLFFLHDPNDAAILPPCTLYRATGLHCTGCGGTRCVGHLVHGRLGEALRCNALAVLAIVGALLYGAKGLLGDRFPLRLPLLRYDVRFAIGLLLVMAAFMVLRNIPAYPFTLLTPSEPPPAWTAPDPFQTFSH